MRARVCTRNSGQLWFKYHYLTDDQTYPVVGNLLLALIGHVRAWRAGHTEPGSDCAVAQIAVWSLSRVIRHEAVDERVTIGRT